MLFKLTKLRNVLDTMQTSDYFIFLGLALMGAGVWIICGFGWSILLLGTILLTIGFIAAMPPRSNGNG